MERGKLINVVVITSRHPLRSHDKLRQEGYVKADKNEASRNLSQRLVVHFACHFWPPVMQASEKGDQRTPHHHVMEMRYYVIGVM